MTDLLLAISGCTGGNQGPQGVYKLLREKFSNNSLHIQPVYTLPDDIIKNVQQITRIASEQLNFYDNVYVMGYSMGGTVAVQMAHELNKEGKNQIKGLVLLATQTEGMHVLSELNIPVLFYHGKEDEFFPPWQIETLFEKYPGPKKMVEIEHVGHNFAPEGALRLKSYTQVLAKHILGEISDFFSEIKQDVKVSNARPLVPISKEISFTHPQTFGDKIKACFWDALIT